MFYDVNFAVEYVKTSNTQMALALYTLEPDV